MARPCELCEGGPAGSRCAAFSFQLLPEEHIHCLVLRQFSSSEVCLYDLFSKQREGVPLKEIGIIRVILKYFVFQIYCS